MDKKSKDILLIVICGVLCYAAVSNFSAVLTGLKALLQLLLPIVVGFVLAFILSVPMNGFEKLLGKLMKGPSSPKKTAFITMLSFILTVISLLGVLVLAFTLLIPELVNSVMGVIEQVQVHLPAWIDTLAHYDVDTERLVKWASELNIESIFSGFTGSVGSLWDSVVSISSSILSVGINVGLGIVVAVYMLLGRKQLAAQAKRLVHVYLKKERADRLCYVAALVHSTFTKFLSGQCLEACILGSLIFIAFSVAGLPYAGLIAVLTGICAFIPYVGAFASCATGALLTLLISPTQALICVVVYISVQFIENQFIYPHVVGSSVGLGPLWTLMAAMMGGKLFGLLGMIFFIPLMAVVYRLISEDMQRRSSAPNIPRDSKFSP